MLARRPARTDFIGSEYAAPQGEGSVVLLFLFLGSLIPIARVPTTGKPPLDKWSGLADHTGIADHTHPDYALAETLPLDQPEQVRALFEETRMQIIGLLSERAATIKELAETLEKPKGTVGHHIGVLEDAGLIHVVRTKKVRAIEAKYYGRTARTFLLQEQAKASVELDPGQFLATAAAEYGRVEEGHPIGAMSALRHARIQDDRAGEWMSRLKDLVMEFAAESRGGDTTYGLVVGLYPTDRPHLPDQDRT
jgi:DNA-binding transcriptional ArsR family regulator